MDILSRDKRIIDLKIQMGLMVFYLSCVYGDLVRARRNRVWEQLLGIGLTRNEPWLLVGDFNELMSNKEKLGGAVRDNSTFWDFRHMAENCKIKELRSIGNQLSWAGVRDRAWVQCRLDRSFGNDEWFRLFPRAQMEYMALWASDHRPIRISFAAESSTLDRGRFYFDKRIVGREGAEEAVDRGWNNNHHNEDTSLLDRIACCRQELSKWKKAHNMNSKVQILELRERLECEITKLSPDLELLKQMKRDLAQAYRDEELFWRQRCREQWLKEGDRNTRYFHNCVKGRKVRNRVLMLMDNNGVEHFSEGAKGHIDVEYFRDLFMSTNPCDLEALFEGFAGRVTPEMNQELTKPASEEEIKKDAFGVKGSSALGEDRLTGCFYQSYWHIVGPALTKEIMSFFSSSVLPAG